MISLSLRPTAALPIFFFAAGDSKKSPAPSVKSGSEEPSQKKQKGQSARLASESCSCLLHSWRRCARVAHVLVDHAAVWLLLLQLITKRIF